MTSPQPAEGLNAETRFRHAFERLKAGQPKVLENGTPVTQNNVAREAGCDPTALKKKRFPALVREIQAYLELHNPGTNAGTRKAKRQKAAKRSLEERLADAIRQRDQAQSILSSANLRIVDLTAEVKELRRRVEEFEPAPTKLGRR